MLLVLALLALSACGTSNPITKPCPTVGILGDAEQLTAFRGTGQDITDVVYRVTLSGASVSCGYHKMERVNGKLKVNLTAERGPALGGTEIKVPYFIAIMRGTKYVLARQEFSETLSLAEQPRTAKAEEIPFNIPLAKQMNGSNYEVIVGLVLTPDELAYNRKVRQR